MSEMTAMFQQYFKIKDKHQDHLLFYRLGDFYEMFFEDALVATRELGLTLTGRDCGLEERAPMCGIPFHSSENYIKRLIKKGYKVAICEQMEDPAAAKGLVSREVVRVITPGTLVENNLLQEDVNNYICSICLRDGGYGLVFADVSTGEINLLELERDGDSAITNELARYYPREVIFNPAFVDKASVAKYLREKLACTADLVEEERFDAADARDRVLAHFGKESLEDLGLEGRPRGVSALGALLYYLGETQKSGLERLLTVNVQEETRFMALNLSARINLELLESLRTREKRGSLLWVLDRAKTPMGKRLIKTYISQPLTNPAEIDKRLNAVEELVGDELLCGRLEDALSGVYDMERLITRIVYGSASPREYKTLETTIGRFPALRRDLSGVKAAYLAAIHREIDELEDVGGLIGAAICPEPPVSVKDGGVIADGYDPDLDVLRELVSNSRDYLARMEEEQREKTGIRSLKIGFNRVFGYYIEVTNTNKNLVPEEYIRKQTLANCERYITQELKELEERITTAHERAIEIEQRIFDGVRRQVARELHRIQRTASAIARLDVFLSFASVSLDYRYVRPEITTGEALRIQEGRHPVVERLLEGAPFVPNDAELDTGESQIAVITGPNMAGKSTYMRQVALIVLMAQIGCFVPAKSASIGVVDGIYTRIGASDDLASGQSTFMVEMVEVADILREATSRSLLILDEIGRGTSTYDGMSIARAVIEYVADRKKLGAKTLFATHYHELTGMEVEVEGVKNYNIAAKKRGDDIIFLRKIVRGGADDSYGIEVSKLAGIPQWVIKRAREVLEDLEKAQPVRQRKRMAAKLEESAKGDFQITLDPGTDELKRMLDEADLNTFTPIEALTFLYKLKEAAK